MLFGALFSWTWNLQGRGGFIYVFPPCSRKRATVRQVISVPFCILLCRNISKEKNRCEEDSMQKLFRVFWKSEIKRGKGIPDSLFESGTIRLVRSKNAMHFWRGAVLSRRIFDQKRKEIVVSCK